MCWTCVYKRHSEEEVVEIRRKVRLAKVHGKSSDYVEKLLHNGCPTGRAHCTQCAFRKNGGKALNKGKGKNKDRIDEVLYARKYF